jgi:Abnormal spindle-like microcephaly-assoc'd, ASPM-SPD-2-Hydin
VLSSNCACARRPGRIIAVLYPRLLFILICCLGVVALSGGYVAHAQYRRGILGGFSCSSASLTGSGSDQCTVTLAVAAGSRGYTVRLASNNAMVAVPATLVVPAGATSAGFTASVASVTSAQTVTLTASANGVSESFALQLNAAAATVPTLSVSPTSVAFGNVTVNTAAELPVTLSSTGTAPVTINSATLTGSGFTLSGATFPVTLNPSLAVTLEVQFDPTAAAAATGQLTIQSNSSTNSTVAISVSGTGEAVLQHQVDLSWDAPGSSPAQITGYNIYRAPGGSTSYQQLNSSVVAQTIYVDSTVQAGSSYDYYVESVDSSGTQSAPSNLVAASVP